MPCHASQHLQLLKNILKKAKKSVSASVEMYPLSLGVLVFGTDLSSCFMKGPKLLYQKCSFLRGERQSKISGFIARKKVEEVLKRPKVRFEKKN